MNTTEKRILSYPHLSAEEQLEVESYVEDHPEWASLLRDVQKLEELADVADASGVSPVGPELLAAYVVMTHLGTGTRTESMGADGEEETGASVLGMSIGQIEEQIRSDPTLRAEVKKMRQRIEEVETGTDPAAQFESLTGHRVADVGSDSSDNQETNSIREDETEIGRDRRDRTPMQQSEHPGTDSRKRAPDREANDRKTESGRLSRISSMQWVTAAVALLFATYGVLYLASWSSQSAVDRLAIVNVNQDVIDSYQTRVRSPLSAEPDTTADELYLQALPLLRDARTATLGLFPHFDHQKLREAEGLLQRVVDQTKPNSFLRLEAYFYLGKINLAQGETDLARSNFKAVVQREGRRATEAYQILKQLEEIRPIGQAPSQGNT